MNAHALAAATTAEPREPTIEAWIVHCAAIQCGWDALDITVRRSIDDSDRDE